MEDVVNMSQLHAECSFRQQLAVEVLPELYPRLTRAMQWTAILAPSEAGAALRDYIYGREAIRSSNPRERMFGEIALRSGGGEAVAHYGGPARLVRDASRSFARHVARIPRA